MSKMELFPKIVKGKNPLFSQNTPSKYASLESFLSKFKNSKKKRQINNEKLSQGGGVAIVVSGGNFIVDFAKCAPEVLFRKCCL